MIRQLLSGLLLTILFFYNSEGQSASSADSIKNLNLFQTIRSGKVAELEKLLAGGVSPNAVMEGYSALMAAALNGTLPK
jgi:hypothetical protein